MVLKYSEINWKHDLLAARRNLQPSTHLHTLRFEVAICDLGLQPHQFSWIMLVPELKLSSRWTIWSQAVAVLPGRWDAQFPASQEDLSEDWLSRQGQVCKDSCWDSFAWFCTVKCLMIAGHVYFYSHVYVAEAPVVENGVTLISGLQQSSIKNG